MAMLKSGRLNVGANALPGPAGLVWVLDATTAPKLVSSVARMAKLGTVRSSNTWRTGRKKRGRVAARGRFLRVGRCMENLTFG
jgi:hypothetical protein